jgi:hypothetical protein
MTADATTPTYRETKPSKGKRRPLAEVHLAGPPRHVHRALAGARIAVVLTAIVAFFMPWHVVHPLSNGSWGDAFCWGPDCHPTPPATPAPPTPPTYGPAYTCTGWSHANTVLPLVLLVVLLIVALVPFRRPRFGLAFVLAIVDVLILFGFAYALFDLKHMFDHVDVLVGERVFQSTMGIVAMFVAADVFVTPILYVWGRSRLLRT